MLISSAAGAVAMASGCREKSDPSVDPVTPRRDVPLRVTMVGGENDADVLRRAWSAVSPQPLKIESIKLDRSEPQTASAQLQETVKKSDVVLYPLALVAELALAESVIPLSEDEFQAMEDSSGKLLSGVRNGGARYAGKMLTVPLGAQQPALLAVDQVEELEELEDWGDYDRWVQTLGGRAAEPLAPGWAAAMFLWRAASMLDRGWLFAREPFEPLVGSEPYVEVLRQMTETAARYPKGRQTPAEIWQGLQSGALQGGIGFPTDVEPTEIEISCGDLPSTVERNRVLLDPFSPVASLSSACRQSAASKQFLQWLGGGEGTGSVRRQVSGMTITHARQRENTESVGSHRSYDRWLQERLSTPVTAPTLQLLAAGEYYASLDEQIGRCLDGEVEPDAALAAVSERWRSIADRVGVDKQLRAWRRAQGMG